MKKVVKIERIHSKEIGCEYDVDLVLKTIQTDEGFIASINGIETVPYIDAESINEMIHQWACELVQQGEILPTKSSKLKWKHEDGLYRLYRGEEPTKQMVVPSPFHTGWAVFSHGSLTVDGLKLAKAKKMARSML